MKIKSNVKIHSVEWLVKMMDSGRVNTDIAVQRRYVWDKNYKSNLIMTILHNAPVANLTYEVVEGGYSVIDGKQRSLTLYEYTQNKFNLSKKLMYTIVDGTDVGGKKFSKLPQDLQERIMQYQLAITMVDEMNEEERNFLFYQQNQGVLLTKLDLLTSVLGQDKMDKINDLCNHDFIMEKLKLTAPALKKRNDVKIVVQYLILQSGLDMGLSSKEIMDFCSKLKNDEVTVDYEKIDKLLDYLVEVFPMQENYLKKSINVPVIMYVAQQAMDSKVTDEELKKKLDKFYEAPTKEYVEASQTRTADKGNVSKRLSALQKALGFAVSNNSTKK